MFDINGDGPLETLPCILVEQETLDADDIYLLPSGVVEFVHHVTGVARYVRGELPEEAFQCFHVDYYIAQVSNGGHSQYVSNSGWRDFQIADIRAGLAAIGDVEAIDLFEDLCGYADSHPAEFQSGMVAGGFGGIPDFFSKADDAFFGSGLGERLMKGNGDRIRELDCLLALPFMECRRVMADLPKRNPNYKARGREEEPQPPKKPKRRWWPW